ncbi:hypothetical protein BV25DRAFT_1922755 [Artomyces pyxidatus]|uniref:Uncharacterized protein n=1 Tax=Artomyces pyxidatus TaxID=48021 RepID=A0ACB8SEI1_9AGAM|nr:hypothetical protein BV25DRAFT_1922755 [Artomyces pyxidatus]
MASSWRLGGTALTLGNLYRAELGKRALVDHPVARAEVWYCRARPRRAWDGIISPPMAKAIREYLLSFIALMYISVSSQLLPMIKTLQRGAPSTAGHDGFF